MKLRWLIIETMYGLETDPVLQYKETDKKDAEWKDVKTEVVQKSNLTDQQIREWL